jgi:hypothetical protein
MNKEMVLGVVRHILTALGGAGFLDAYATQDEITAAVAAVITLVGLGWSVLAKKEKN